MSDSYIDEFIAAVCPEAPHLYMASFNEKQCLIDATKIINDLRAENRKSRELLERIQTTLEAHTSMMYDEMIADITRHLTGVEE